MFSWVPPAYGKDNTQEDTPAPGSAAEPERTAPPRQWQGPPPDAAEFVICDHTIETFFADQKSRGFHLHTSHLSEPKRFSRLLMATCFAYIWIVSLGAICMQDGWVAIIHRRHRCDLSLFQQGLRLLDHLLNEDLPIPVAFHISV